MSRRSDPDCLQRAFEYLLEETPCGCSGTAKRALIHEAPCPIAIAVSIAEGELRDPTVHEQPQLPDDERILEQLQKP